MFIALISRGVPSKRDPQWGCFEKDQAEALAATGHKVVVISVDTRFRFYWRKLGISHYYTNGIHYYDCFIVPGVIIRKFFGKRLHILLVSIQLQRLFRRIVREYGRPDIIYSHYLTYSCAALSLKDKYHLPLVAIEHWSQLDKDVLSDYAVWLGNLTYPKCDAIISVSDSLRRRLLQHFQIDSIVVHNMVGVEFCESYSRGSLDGKVRYVSTGSLIYRNGFDLLISAFDRLKLPSDKWELTIIGEGKERANLECQINQVGLSNNIHLVGRMGKNEIAKILSSSDVFIFPSRSENFSVAVLEALCLGMPVIASICGGIKECVNSSNGLLFPVEDIGALSIAINTMYENCHQYDRKKIMTDNCARFTPSVIARQLTDVFNEVVIKK